MFFNKFDIMEAYYMYGYHYHSGQDSKEYAYMSRALEAGFSPGHALSYDRLTENGQAIYDSLIHRSLKLS